MPDSFVSRINEIICEINKITGYEDINFPYDSIGILNNLVDTKSQNPYEEISENFNSIKPKESCTVDDAFFNKVKAIEDSVIAQINTITGGKYSVNCPRDYEKLVHLFCYSKHNIKVELASDLFASLAMCSLAKDYFIKEEFDNAINVMCEAKLLADRYNYHEILLKNKQKKRQRKKQKIVIKKQ